MADPTLEAVGYSHDDGVVHYLQRPAIELIPMPAGTEVAGLDLSLTGSAVARCTRTGSQVTLHGKGGITNLPVAQQIWAIDELVEQVVQAVFSATARLDAAVIEALDNAQAYGGSTERTVLWWKVVERLHDGLGGAPIWMPTSSQVKIYATGSGLATKGEMTEQVTRHWPYWEHRGNDNQVDAAAMAELCLALMGSPSKQMPKEHTRVLPRIRSITDPPARVVKRQAAKR